MPLSMGLLIPRIIIIELLMWQQTVKEICCIKLMVFQLLNKTGQEVADCTIFLRARGNEGIGNTEK